ncbi:MAG: hypothetical protein QOE30_4296 [Mycobacterium sp.]|jgi:hypothetical protein|uniref:hypothetical protein n=1 Tax=Mycobacterium sp. TaxID=1785 RepID=UPI0028B8937A|nr:hypothetical protein [Mycobacterium sp.]MDT5118557.1 hypothetical protein [Mycobacterium sp.]
MLTISKLKQWSINYYIDTAQAAEHAARDLARAGGEPDEYWWTGTAWYSRPFASRYSKPPKLPSTIRAGFTAWLPVDCSGFDPSVGFFAFSQRGFVTMFVGGTPQ